MPKKINKKTHFVHDIWQAYAKRLLLAHPEYWGRYHNHTDNCYIYTKKDNKIIEVITYPKFRRIIEVFFDKAKRAIIAGETYKIGSYLGKICARRVERDFRKKTQRRINWEATRRQPKIWNEEKQKEVYKHVIYYTDDDWCRIGWNKPENAGGEGFSKFYEFKPTKDSRAGTGFAQQFTAALKADPILKYAYLFYPLRTRVKPQEVAA